MKLTIDKKELTEIYNALCCLNTEIKEKQKRRAKYIQKIIIKIYDIIDYNKTEW